MARKTQPAATDRRPPRHPFKYRQQFGVIVVCESEAHQRRVFRQLLKAGLKLRVVVV